MRHAFIFGAAHLLLPWEQRLLLSPLAESVRGRALSARRPVAFLGLLSAFILERHLLLRSPDGLGVETCWASFALR